MIRHILFSVSFGALLIVPAAAQEMPMMRGKAAERIEQLKKVRMMEELNLEEEVWIKFFARYNKHRDDVEELAKERMKAVRHLEELETGNAPDAELGKAVTDILDIEKKISELRSRYYEDLKEILSQKQIAQYIVFEWKFYRNLRERLQEMEKNRPGQRPWR